MHSIYMIVCLLLGGLGLLLALGAPLERNLSEEHSFGLGVVGLIWLGACVLLALNI